MLREINVTPLVDVVLVLLLIFMVTVPMMSRGIDVSLPVADQPQIPQEDRITVSLRSDGTVLVADQPVNPPPARGPAQGPDLRPAGERGVPPRRRGPALRPVIKVVDVIRRAGIDRIGFVYALPEEKRR